MPDAAPVLSPNLHGRGICHHVFSSISGNMGIYARLQRFQKRGLTMIAAAHDQRYPFSDSHSADLPLIGKAQSHFHGFRG